MLGIDINNQEGYPAKDLDIYLCMSDKSNIGSG